MPNNASILKYKWLNVQLNGLLPPESHPSRLRLSGFILDTTGLEHI